MMRLPKRFLAMALLALGAHSLSAQSAPETSALLMPQDFAKLHALIKPQTGESRFQEIPWLLSVWDPRKKAAEEGKPILVWAGAGGAPTGVC